MKRQVATGMAVTVFWLLGAAPAAADVSGPAAAPGSSGGGATAGTGGGSGEELAAQAYEAYRREEFAQAISLYLRAYQATPSSEILFNVATIYDKKLHEPDLAIDYYRRFLRESDDAALVPKASDRLNALRAEREAAKGPTSGAAAASTDPAQTKEEDPGRTMRTAGLVIGAAGLVGVVVGSVFGLNAKSKNDEAADMCSGTVCRDPRAIPLTSDAQAAATVSTIAFAAGGVALAGGAALYFLAPKKPSGGTGLQVAPQVGLGSAGLVLGGSWQ